MWLDVNLSDEWYGNRKLLSGFIYKVSLAVVIYKRTILGYWYHDTAYSEILQQVNLSISLYEALIFILGCINTPQINGTGLRWWWGCITTGKLRTSLNLLSIDRMVQRCICDLRLLAKLNLSSYCLINDFLLLHLDIMHLSGVAAINFKSHELIWSFTSCRKMFLNGGHQWFHTLKMQFKWLSMLLTISSGVVVNLSMPYLLSDWNLDFVIFACFIVVIVISWMKCNLQNVSIYMQLIHHAHFSTILILTNAVFLYKTWVAPFCSHS